MADKWILSACNNLVKEVTENLEKFELGVALSKVYDFVWDNYCDWYIEIVKPRLFDAENPTRLEAQFVLNEVLVKCMKLLHPFMPFVTEEIYQSLYKDAESIMISKWPEFEDKYVYTQDEADMAYVIDAIRQIRNIRHEMNVPMSKKAQLIAVTTDDAKASVLQAAEPLLKALAACSALTVQGDKTGISDDAASVALENAQLYIPLEELIDIQKEIERLTKEKENLEKELKRVSGKLSNEGFMAKAPANVIAEERAKLDKYTSMYGSVEERLRVMKERCV